MLLRTILYKKTPWNWFFPQHPCAKNKNAITKTALQKAQRRHEQSIQPKKTISLLKSSNKQQKEFYFAAGYSIVKKVSRETIYNRTEYKCKTMHGSNFLLIRPKARDWHSLRNSPHFFFAICLSCLNGTAQPTLHALLNRAISRSSTLSTQCS